MSLSRSLCSRSSMTIAVRIVFPAPDTPDDDAGGIVHEACRLHLNAEDFSAEVVGKFLLDCGVFDHLVSGCKSTIVYHHHVPRPPFDELGRVAMAAVVSLILILDLVLLDFMWLTGMEVR